MSTRPDCPRCDGTGHIEDEDHGSPPCPDCAGEGVLPDGSGCVPRAEEPRDCLALAVHGRTRDNEGM